MKLAACAKLNLYLAVGGRRQDGYHELVSVMQSVSLADTVTIDFHQREFSLQCQPPAGPAEQNIAARSWRLLKERYGLAEECAIRLDKQIPQGAGLAGGSVDGAAVLVAANHQLKLGLSPEELRSLSAEIGSDLPFCIEGGTALVQGRGERVTTLPPLKDVVFVLVNGGTNVSTAAVFRCFDQLTPPPPPPLAPLLTALANGDTEQLERSIFNSLEAVAATQPPLLQKQRQAMTALGLRPHMSGSGPTLFALTDAGHAARAAARWPAELGRLFVAHPTARAVQRLGDEG